MPRNVTLLNSPFFLPNRHWVAQEYIWIIVAYMTYDIYIMYLCHWHKSAEKGVTDRKHSLASVKSFLWRERLMVTHHLFILIVLTPVAVVRAQTEGCLLGRGLAGLLWILYWATVLPRLKQALELYTRKWDRIGSPRSSDSWEQV